MYTLITFATHWGSKYGGINSFNTDFLSAFGVAYHFSVQVICIVSAAGNEEVKEAEKAYVNLVPLPHAPQDKLFTEAHGLSGIEELKKRNINFDPEMTVWLGHDRITGTAANAAAKTAGGLSALIHHMSYDHYESYAENSQTANHKTQGQKDLFKQADIVLAVGPLLRDALRDLIGASKPVHMLIPGLAEIVPVEAPITFTVFLSGRLSEDTARIKQGHLGVAAFAQAHREARENGMPDGLYSQPKLVLRGIDFDAQVMQSPSQPQSDPETELKLFAEKYAESVINLHALPFTQDRETFYNDLKGASVALMPSWHEGFGLVAWEAIAAGVPLIVSRNSGVYRFLEENHPGAGTGCVNVVDVRAAVSPPFFRSEDLQAVTAALKIIANKPHEARRKASTLRGLLDDYTWSSCAAQGAQAFGWSMQKGSIPVIEPVSVEETTSRKTSLIVSSVSSHTSPLQIPLKCWKLDAGITDSQLLRAEESIVPFDPAHQPELDALNCWLDDTKWPQAIRLITGAGGSGKTRLALELCQQRLTAGWQAGFLDIAIDAKDMANHWQTLREFSQPLLISIDYAETRQSDLLALIRAMLQTPIAQTVRILLLARDGGEWWDNLPSKDHQCELLLSGYTTSGPFRLSALHATISDRNQAYRQALHSYAQALSVTASDMIPELTAVHFERPLYVQMLALLALHGERPTTAQGLTKALLNHERRYWRRLLSHFGWAEPERLALQLLALATLAGGFATPRAAEPYWTIANGTLRSVDFNALFQTLVPLYPSSKQGLQGVRPDLLGEALVAQALLCPEGTALLDAVLSSSAGASIRRHALTVLARLSGQRLDLHETLVDALVHHFSHCYQEMIPVAIETPGRLSNLAETAFTRLQTTSKSQIAGLLEPFFHEESVQIVGLGCLVMEYLVEKCHQKISKRSIHSYSMVEYIRTLDNYSLCLRRSGRHEKALAYSQDAIKLFERLNLKDQQVYAFDYADSLSNYSIHLNDAGKNEEALKYTRKALDIQQRLAQKNPDRYEPHYATVLANYSVLLSDAGQNEEALKHDQEALEIRRRLAQKNPDRYEPDYAMSLSNYSAHLSKEGKNKEALKHIEQALDIQQRLAQKNPDRYESGYAALLNNYSIFLSHAGQNEEALKHDQEALEIRRRLAQKNPDRYEPDYAMSLINYSADLSTAGQYEDALKYDQQALDIQQRLAQKNPDQYESGYAALLNNYSIHLTAAGHNEEVLKRDREALEIHRRLAKKDLDRYESDYATSLSNYSNHLNTAGDNEEAIRHGQQALEIRRRLTQKNPDRYEPYFASSLNNCSFYLSDSGHNEEALRHGQLALEIRHRLAQKDPDRYETDYSESLNNYSQRLLDAGNYELALQHAREALAIRHRLATKAPKRFDGDMLGSTCSVSFINWLCDHFNAKEDLPDSSLIPTTVPIQSRARLVLVSSFVKACLATEPTARTKTFKLVLSTWENLSPANKHLVRCYWLCAAAWCATAVPEVVANLDWQGNWRQYINQRQGQLPHWMRELALRLEFQWPT
ncbi:MAG: tetratricopeptide repeat protein [Pseudomonadota bacterium]